MERKNLAVEALQMLLVGEIKSQFSQNYVKETKFSELLHQALMRYRSGTIEATQMVEELISIGRQVRRTVEEERTRGLNKDEAVFYDALAENSDAREVLGDAQLCNVAKALLRQVRRDVTIDWAERKNAQAKLRINIKKILMKHGYPSDQQTLATDMVLEQAKRYGGEWGCERATYDTGGANIID